MRIFQPFEDKPGFWTWSAEARLLLTALDDAVVRLPEPQLVNLSGGIPFDHTYTLDPGMLSDAILRSRLDEFAAALRQFHTDSGRTMFSGLLDKGVSSQALHYLLAFTRHCIAVGEHDSFAALYAPLGKTGPDVGEFRLHADLYDSRSLLNIFDHVATDGTGESTFLPVSDFFEILDQTSSMDESARDQIKALFSPTTRGDRFMDFKQLVHGEQNPWYEDLWNAMSATQETMPLVRGQGYLLDDRLWLHGRTAPSGGVPAWRSHRLTFRPRN